ncbi:MAG TPA: DUF4129 domain-containing protein [Actinomycetes bacterium]|nr:DUF4129 domain-containing protein [Actinomycetes bacterium]
MAEDRQPERRTPPGRGATRRRLGSSAAPPAIAAVLLLALVAVGSLRGPLGSGRGRPSYPADLVDSLLLLILLAMVAAGLLAVMVLLPHHRPNSPRRRRNSTFGVLLPLAVILVLWLLRHPLGLDGLVDRVTPSSTPTPPSSIEVPTAPPSPGVVPLVVAGTALLAMIAIVAAQLLADRRGRHPPRSPAARLVELVDDTLDDLEREPDPRRAVIAAWARMERGLAAVGFPRRAAEAPFEYAARVLEAAWASPTSVHRLTDLFERAKFSHHTIDRADRDAAIAALRAVRRELAEAVELADATAAASPP